MSYVKLSEKHRITELEEGMELRLILTSEAINSYMKKELSGALISASPSGIRLDNVNDGKVIRLNEIEEVVIVDDIY